MKITKITLKNGQVRLYEGPAILAQYTIRIEKLDVSKIEEMEAVQLIGHGLVPAKRANEIKIGDVIGYNYGYAAKVIGIEEASPAYFTFTLTETGKIWDTAKGPETYTQRKKKTGFVPLMEEW